MRCWLGVGNLLDLLLLILFFLDDIIVDRVARVLSKAITYPETMWLMATRRFLNVTARGLHLY